VTDVTNGVTPCPRCPNPNFCYVQGCLGPPKQDEPAKLGPVTPMFPDSPPEESSLQQAMLDSGAKPVEGVVPTFRTNEGTVFLASPADIDRASMMDSVSATKLARATKVSNAEIDRLMKEDRD